MSSVPAARNKVVLVTGASAGIGASVARELARQGYDLALTARRADRLTELANELRKLNANGAANQSRVIIIPATLEDPETPEMLVRETLTQLGAIDVLINNAGFGLPAVFAESDPVEIRRQLEVNFVAPLMLARAALPYLLERRGMIINVGSSITSVPNSALGAYGATKAGLAYWNDALRRELIHRGVRVCLVEPGPVKTEFFSALEKLAPPGHAYNPMLDAPAPWMSARVEDVAARIVRLINKPKRRLSVLRRVVWPFRLVGGLFRFCPPLGDLALSSMAKHFDRRGDLSRVSRSSSDARPAQ